ncbi:helix-turn-helix transcriptional regulator [Nocardiopsis suaedae]|uniref:Helix-turn-helix transcriptional regulator n=1 Tax=Nocardiopsis suaedae TaxID=3018444 RepID=A0ABT4TF20_9ACTN|nr:helix-turn-helix transcriptional regulator [Nocardiopsis suaedae]MDA2803293.1 helix-turn-helix transcriptional regulator [Nocardiopsis suaedae]
MSASTPPADPALRRHEELRHFLRTRRARLTPQDVGMPEAGRRRTPGLRREEVAVLSGVGVSWYTRLEQGRDINVSGGVLDAIARTLRMDAAEREHLYLLSGLNPPPASPEPGARVPDELVRVLDSWSPRPAYIRDRYWNLTAVNDAAAEVLGYGGGEHNCLVTFFTSARYRALARHWSAAAPDVVGRFRGDAARYQDDPEFGRIASDLVSVSPEFAELWERHEVLTGSRAVKAVVHPQAGDLVFETTLLGIPELPGHSLVLYNPRPDTGTQEALERLMTSVRLAAAG